MSDPRTELHHAMKRLRNHRRELARLDALRVDELDQIALWYGDAAHGEKKEIATLTATVELLARVLRDETGDASWSTPWGTVASRLNAVGRTVVVDQAAFEAWCTKHDMLHAQKPAPPQAPDVAKLRKAAMVHDGALVLEGEIIPGVAIEGFGEITYDVEVAQ